MKKFFSSIFLILILGNLSISWAQIAPSNYPFSIKTTVLGNSISIEAFGPSAPTRTLQAFISEKTITQNELGTGLEKNVTVLGKSYWKKTGLKENTDYYIRVLEIAQGRTAGSFVTEQFIVKTDSLGEIFFSPVVFNSGTQTFSGSIDTTKHKETDLVPLSSITIGINIYEVNTKNLISKLVDIKTIDPSGKFTFSIKGNSLNPGSWYDAEVIFSSTTGSNASSTYKFNTKEGIIPQTGTARDDFFDKNSYRLLAPIPGISALLDPALCQLEKQTNPGQICDVNAFLNFMLNLLIGLAAVVLVVRIIITGYGYMITDVPFVKAKMKGGFRDALLGLIVALASYTILNTINPKLVENEVNIGAVSFDVKQYPSIDSGTYEKITGQKVLPKSKYVDMAKMVAAEYKIDECLLIATATAESNMDPTVFGSDADFAESPKISSPSRRAFINSGEKYSGAKFQKGDSKLRTDRSFKNDAPKGVVDGRFSFGFGMLGITMFPEGYGTKSWEAGPSISLKNKPLVMDGFWPLNPKTNKKYTYTELLDAETSLRLGAFLLQKKVTECKDPYTAMYAFNKGGCPKDSNGSSTRRTVYNQCKGIR